jgi:hypothetical protein
MILGAFSAGAFSFFILFLYFKTPCPLPFIGSLIYMDVEGVCFHPTWYVRGIIAIIDVWILGSCCFGGALAITHIFALSIAFLLTSMSCLNR